MLSCLGWRFIRRKTMIASINSCIETVHSLPASNLNYAIAAAKETQGQLAFINTPHAGLKTAMNLPNVEVVSTSVTALQFQEQIKTMVGWSQQRVSATVCVANVHMLMESRHNQKLKTALHRANMVTPDGMPLAWAMRALGVTGQDRVAGMDIFLAVCKECSKKDVSIFLLGSTQEVLDKMQSRLKTDFPNLKVAGAESPPFRPLTAREDAELTQRINNSGAGFTFLALGCPKQECWMLEHQGRVKSVMVGIGGVFPIYAGLQKYAPSWIRSSGLEWFYRLLQEPKRLCRRYFTTIPPFIFLALVQILTQRNHQRASFRLQVDYPKSSEQL